MKSKLHSIIARAAVPHERTLSCFRILADQEPERIVQREHDWIQAAAGSDRSRFEMLLAAQGLNWNQFHMQLSDVEIADAAALPRWAHWMLEISGTDIPAAFPEDSGVFTPFLSFGFGKLREIAESCGEDLSENAMRSMLGSLLWRLGMACRAILAQQLHLDHLARGFLAAAIQADVFAQFQQRLSSFSGWIELFDQHPALARIVAVAFLNWQDSTAEFLTRLHHDRSFLQQELFGGHDPGKVMSFRGDAGDIHHHGRTTLLAFFESGQAVVYKPKDLRIGRGLMELIEDLNASGLPCPLPTRKILVRGDYSWEEWVRRAECPDAAAVERFYFRMGMELRLFQLLRGKDFWLDNFVACGEQPVPVDLETLCQPVTDPALSESRSAQQLQKWLEDSALGVGILPLKSPVGPGIRAIEMGAVSPDAWLKTPIRSLFWFDAVLPKREDARYEDGFLVLKADAHLPRFQDSTPDAAESFEALLSGYRSMEDCVRNNRDILLKHVRRMSHFPVRYIFRDTWTYYRINIASTSSRYLKDGIEREICLQRLWKAHLPSGPTHPIIAEEIDSIRELDIPFFQAWPAERAVVLHGRAIQKHFFPETAIVRIEKDLDASEIFPLDDHVRLIRTAFACRDEHAQFQKFSIQRSAAHTARSPEYFVSAASAIADEILEAARRTNDGQIHWIGMVYHPWADMFRVEPLPHDLLSGACGIAILLSDLFLKTGENHYREAAGPILKSILQSLHALPAILASQYSSTAVDPLQFPLYCGMYYGFGSKLYAISRCSQAFTEPNLRLEALQVIRNLPVPVIAKYAPSDLISGRAGLLLSLNGFREEDPALQELRRSLVESLTHRESEVFQQQTLYPPGNRIPDILPGWKDGIALALKYTGETIGLPDSPDPDPTPGRLLSELVLNGPGRAQWSDCLKPFATIDPGREPSWRLLEKLEVLITNDQFRKDDGSYGPACGIAEELLRRGREDQRWFPENRAYDFHCLSAVEGMVALAHAFLKLGDPARIASIHPYRG